MTQGREPSLEDLESEPVLWRGRFLSPRYYAAVVVTALFCMPFLFLYGHILTDANTDVRFNLRWIGQVVRLHDWQGRVIVACSFLLLFSAAMLPFIRGLRTNYELTPRYWMRRSGRTREIWPVAETSHATLRRDWLGCHTIQLRATDTEARTLWKTKATGRFDPVILKNAFAHIGISLSIPVANPEPQGLEIANDENVRWKGSVGIRAINPIGAAGFAIGVSVLLIAIYYLIQIWTYVPKGLLVPEDSPWIGMARFTFSAPFFAIFVFPAAGSLWTCRSHVRGALNRALGQVVITNRRIILTNAMRNRIEHQYPLIDVIDAGHALNENGRGFINFRVVDAAREKSIGPYVAIDNLPDSEGAYAAIMEGDAK